MGTGGGLVVTTGERVVEIDFIGVLVTNCRGPLSESFNMAGGLMAASRGRTKVGEGLLVVLGGG